MTDEQRRRFAEFLIDSRVNFCDCDEPILEEVERGLIQRSKILLCRKCDKPFSVDAM